MKKRFAALLTALAILLTFAFAGCSTPGAPDPTVPSNNSGKLKIVTTIFPVYDWVMNILGDNPAGAEVTLLAAGVDMHSFQPTVEDMLTISTCNIFVYVGGESDRWVEDALSQAVNKNMVTINLLDVLSKNHPLRNSGPSSDATVFYGEGEAEEEHDHDDHADGGGVPMLSHPVIVPDEHVWLSLRRAATICDALYAAISKADPANVAAYQANLVIYKKKLADLDDRFNEAVSAGTVRTLLFGDRFPFSYFASDYGLTCYAAFSGCSSETEASFETIAFLAKKMDDFSLRHVMTIEGTDPKLAQMIINSTAAKDQDILVLNSMQSVSAKDVEDGASYVKYMEDNLEVLKKALS